MFSSNDTPAEEKPTSSRFFLVRSTFSTLCFLAVCLTLSPFIDAAQNQERSLSMQEAIGMSLSQHPELASFVYRKQSADGNIEQAAVGQKQELSVIIEDALGSGEYSSFDNAQSTLSISWILEGELSDRRVGKFQSQRSLVDIETELKRYDVAALTAHHFLAVMAYQERLAIAKQAKQHSRAILDEIIKRVHAGKAPIVDQLRAEVSYERRKLEVEDIHHELKSRKKVLASMWGAVDINFTSLSGSLMLAHQPISYDELEKSIRSSPQVNLFLTQARMAESEITLAHAEAKNRLRLNAGIRHDEQSDDYGLTFGVSLPLGTASRNQGRISALTAQMSRYQVEAQAKEIQLLTQIFVLYEELKHSYHITKSLEIEIIPRLETALQETQTAYQLGKYSYQEWSVVQQELLDAHLALIDAQVTAHNNTIEIERVTGLALLRQNNHQ